MTTLASKAKRLRSTLTSSNVVTFSIQRCQKKDVAFSRTLIMTATFILQPKSLGSKELLRRICHSFSKSYFVLQVKGRGITGKPQEKYYMPASGFEFLSSVKFISTRGHVISSMYVFSDTLAC